MKILFDTKQQLEIYSLNIIFLCINGIAMKLSTADILNKLSKHIDTGLRNGYFPSPKSQQPIFFYADAERQRKGLRNGSTNKSHCIFSDFIPSELPHSPKLIFVYSLKFIEKNWF